MAVKTESERESYLSALTLLVQWLEGHPARKYLTPAIRKSFSFGALSVTEPGVEWSKKWPGWTEFVQCGFSLHD